MGMSNTAGREAIKERAKANQEQSGKDHGIGKVPQISAKPIAPIETREEIAKLAGGVFSPACLPMMGGCPRDCAGCAPCIWIFYKSYTTV
jgi:hypothetical protein